jgi:hypothetical protein
MAKLSDLINVNINKDVISIQGVDIPIMFTMTSFAYVEEAYGKPYPVFEKNLYSFLDKGKGKVKLGENEIRHINTLVYAMIRSGGTDATFDEIESSIPPKDLPAIFKKVLNVFNNQNFQTSDASKIKGSKKK